MRNGPNPKHGPTPHWFAGDGMLHGVRLRDGRAEWYRNRWVRTKALDGVERRDANGTADLTVGLANTHIVRHAGRIFALEEGSLPNEISPELDTLGPYDFDGRAAHAVHRASARVRRDGRDALLRLRADPRAVRHVPRRRPHGGAGAQRSRSTSPGATMVHDFAISRNHAIFLDLPVVFDLDLAISGTMPFQWSESYGARIGLLHRGPRPARRATAVVRGRPPCYVFHIMNAWETAPTAARVARRGPPRSMWRGGPEAFEPSLMHRWWFDLAPVR